MPKKEVASFTDAWIETILECLKVWIGGSHLLQMRGLKQKDLDNLTIIGMSHLLQMRGLKPYPLQ